jgi:ABC-type transporter Mla MlaB component
MLRITRLAGQHLAQTLKLEGKLVGPWVAEVRQVCGHSAKVVSRLILDLSCVSFVDAAGVKLLRDLLDQGITLGACSPLVKELLHAEAR